MSKTVVDKLYEDYLRLSQYFDENGEISFKNLSEEQFKKNLTLSAASYFESYISDSLIEIFANTYNSTLCSEFVKSKAISRQYHTYFDWNSNNANSFFSLFGVDFKAFMVEQVKSDAVLKKSIEDFIELGRERNRLVHLNFGMYSLEKTTDELYTLYKSAFWFVTKIPVLITSFQKKNLERDCLDSYCI